MLMRQQPRTLPIGRHRHSWLPRQPLGLAGDQHCHRHHQCQSWWSGPAWSLFQTVVIAGRNPSHKCFKVSLPMIMIMIMSNSHDIMKMIINGFCDFCDCCSGLEGPATALVKSVDCSFPPDTWAAFYRTQVNLGSDLWVRMSVTHYKRFVRLNWCDSGWWGYLLNTNW